MTIPKGKARTTPKAREKIKAKGKSKEQAKGKGKAKGKDLPIGGGKSGRKLPAILFCTYRIVLFIIFNFMYSIRAVFSFTHRQSSSLPYYDGQRCLFAACIFVRENIKRYISKAVGYHLQEFND